MKIASTDLILQAEQTSLLRRESRETLRTWRGERPNFSAAETRPPLASAIADISAAGQRLLAASGSVPPAPTSATAPAASAIEAASAAADNDPFLALIRRMIEMLTGEEVRVLDLQSFAAAMRHTETQAASVQSVQSAPAAASTGTGRAGFGVEYDYHALREEFEATSFSAAGIVRTSDGQEISFQLDLEMTRYTREETHVSVRAGDAVRKDPIVVNFGGTAAELSSRAGQSFRFDLDGDGQAEALPLFASGSGFLALDLNHDGRIEAKELFGPQSGNGFAELARLDSDGNGWIDAADPAFGQLAVWSPAAEGAGTLRSLADLDIGALALAHVATPFALRGAANEDLGVVKSSGLFLTGAGKAGNLQEIDLTV